jgi:hypothetical protein
MWGDSWIDLNIHTEHIATRLTAAGVPADLITSLGAITRECWRSNQEIAGFDDDGAEVHGISTDLLEARRDVVRAAGAYLLRTGTGQHRSRLLLAAIDRVDKATTPDPG